MVPKQDFVLIAENLALDLINTQCVRNGRVVDTLDNPVTLVDWLVQAGTLDTVRAKTVLRHIERRKQGTRVYEQARRLRGALRAMAEHIVAGKPVPQSSLNVINEVLSYGVGHTQLIRVRGGFEKHLHRTRDDAVQLLVPIAETAADLLCHGDLSLVKKCANPRCILYFYDTTKNHARRWCSMAGCGNRMKAAAHYRRLHST